MLCAENMCKLLRATSNYSHMQNMPATLHRSNIHARSCRSLASTCATITSDSTHHEGRPAAASARAAARDQAAYTEQAET